MWMLKQPMTIQTAPNSFARWHGISLPTVWDSRQVVGGLGRATYNQAACVKASAASTWAAGPKQTQALSLGGGGGLGSWARPETADERSYSLVSSWLAATPTFWRGAKTKGNFLNPGRRCAQAGLLFSLTEEWGGDVCLKCHFLLL